MKKYSNIDKDILPLIKKGHEAGMSNKYLQKIGNLSQTSFWRLKKNDFDYDRYIEYMKNEHRPKAKKEVDVDKIDLEKLVEGVELQKNAFSNISEYDSQEMILYLTRIQRDCDDMNKKLSEILELLKSDRKWSFFK